MNTSVNNGRMIVLRELMVYDGLTRSDLPEILMCAIDQSDKTMYGIIKLSDSKLNKIIEYLGSRKRIDKTLTYFNMLPTMYDIEIKKGHIKDDFIKKSIIEFYSSDALLKLQARGEYVNIYKEHEGLPTIFSYLDQKLKGLK